MNKIYYCSIMDTDPCLMIASDEVGLIAIGIEEHEKIFIDELEKKYSNSVIIYSEEKNEIYIEQLKDYFQGNRKKFDFPLHVEGTEFQKTVWRALINIPYGQTMSYGEIAEKIGNPKAVRAVGGANNRNPIPIVIPCHRVIGADQRLIGYGGGLHIKKKLLQLEGIKIEAEKVVK